MALELKRLPQAQRDATDIWVYVAADNLPPADRLLEQIDATIQNLARLPELGRARPELAPEIRSFPIGSYVVFYRIAADALEVVRILSAYRETSEQMLLD